MDDNNLEKRIEETLRITESRGYNLTKQKLADKLIGGKITIDQLEYAVKSMKNIVFDDFFIATTENPYFEKCKDRKEKNSHLNKIFLRIAKEFIDEYIQICPWVYCIMLTGSIGSEGVCEKDDIDLDLVVEDHTKYFSYLIAILLSLKYSIKYKKQFHDKYLGFISKVICISVIWEKHQVLPFTRKDEQIAFELLNVKVMYNSNFFRKILHNNLWLNNFFPQIFEENEYKKDNKVDEISISTKKKCPRIFENISFAFMFFFYKIIILSRSKNPALKDRMNLVEKVKYPYGIFDVPR